MVWSLQHRGRWVDSDWVVRFCFLHAFAQLSSETHSSHPLSHKYLAKYRCQKSWVHTLSDLRHFRRWSPRAAAVLWRRLVAGGGSRFKVVVVGVGFWWWWLFFCFLFVFGFLVFVFLKTAASEDCHSRFPPSCCRGIQSNIFMALMNLRDGVFKNLYLSCSYLGRPYHCSREWRYWLLLTVTTTVTGSIVPHWVPCLLNQIRPPGCEGLSPSETLF